MRIRSLGKSVSDVEMFPHVYRSL